MALPLSILTHFCFCFPDYFTHFCGVNTKPLPAFLMNTVFLLLGGNLGNVSETFRQARRHISLKVGPVRKASSLYQSEPWGFEAETLFLNQVLVVETLLEPAELLEVLLRIEEPLGRKRTRDVMESRSIDIDILFYNDQVILTSSLEVPHPRLHLRRFTLMPLVEIAPEMMHPLMGMTMKELLESCEDDLRVEKLDLAEDTAE